MDETTASQSMNTEKPNRDPWEGVPPGCGTPRSWGNFYLGLFGFFVWVGLLIILMLVRFRVAAV